MRLRIGSQAARDDLLHEIADQLQDLIAVLDENLRYLFVNAASWIVAGADPADTIGRRADDFVIADASDDILSRLGTEPQDAGSYRFILPIHHANGEIRWLEFEASRIGLPAVQGQRGMAGS